MTEAILADWNRDRAKTTPETMMDAMWAMRRYDLQTALTGIKPELHIVFGRENVNGMKTVPSVRQFAEFATDLDLTLRSDSPISLVRPHAENAC